MEAHEPGSWSLFGLLMPYVGAVFAMAAGLAIGLSTGGVALLMVLGASASYIAVPAALQPGSSGGAAFDLSYPVAGYNLPDEPDHRHTCLYRPGSDGGRLTRR
jgi:hypothetical protein